MIFLAVLLLVATGVLRIFANSPVWKGKRGEEIVAARLKRQLPESYLMINDVYLPLEDGTTTQIISSPLQIHS